MQHRYTYITNRGFTGHEHIRMGISPPLEGLGEVINMNGRVYDPVVARFLSADDKNIIPISTQHFNRYSYVLNNPLKYVDPTGWFELESDAGTKKLRKEEKSLLKEIVKMFKKEAKNYTQKDFDAIKLRTGLTKKQFMKSLKNGNGPILKFGNLLPGVAQTTNQKIVLGQEIKSAIKSLIDSRSSGQMKGTLANNNFVKSESKQEFLNSESKATTNFINGTMLHEMGHWGAKINGLNDPNHSKQISLDENGYFLEREIRNDIVENSDCSAGYNINNSSNHFNVVNPQNNQGGEPIYQQNLLNDMYPWMLKR